MIKNFRYKLNSRIKVFLFNLQKKKKRKEIFSFYAKSKYPDEATTVTLSYLKNHSLSNFYGAFQHKYCADNVEVHNDYDNGLKYVLENNKRLYFKRTQSKRTIQLIYNQLLIEQDPESPHCYTDQYFFVDKKTLLVDAGCAEGYFSFQHIDTLQKVYLFESDSEWIEALEATFKPWEHKSEIVSKFVSDQTTDDQTSLDDFFENKLDRPNFYKIDVEGAEHSVLNGMKRLLQQPNLQIALCTYHNAEDLEIFTRFLTKKEFSVFPNPGLMIYMHDLRNLKPPYFRTCLIKASKYDQSY
ncbi:MAG: FkbM family methyltransferase [Candidatus Saccharimonadaceae bacterium]